MFKSDRPRQATKRYNGCSFLLEWQAGGICTCHSFCTLPTNCRFGLRSRFTAGEMGMCKQPAPLSTIPYVVVTRQHLSRFTSYPRRCESRRTHTILKQNIRVNVQEMNLLSRLKVNSSLRSLMFGGESNWLTFSVTSSGFRLPRGFTHLIFSSLTWCCVMIAEIRNHGHRTSIFIGFIKICGRSHVRSTHKEIIP